MSEAKPVVIRFMAPVDAVSIQRLMAAIDKKIHAGVEHITLLIASPGGSVFHGLSAYNWLKGIPIALTTHNFGSVDSIGVVLYCAGSTRYTVPHSRFLMHGIKTSFMGANQLEEKQVEERLKSMQIDIWNIANVIAATTGTPVEEVNRAIIDRVTLNADEAVAWGLAHEVRADLFGRDVELIAIDQATGGMPGPRPVRVRQAPPPGG